MTSWVKAARSEAAQFLDMHPNANHLLNVIARRARREPCPRTGLLIGECFVGHKGVGMTEQQYRTAKKQLTKWDFAEFKKAGRVTDQGTVAKLINTEVYDINSHDGNGRVTEDQRETNGSLTTNKECKKERMEEVTSKSIVPSVDVTPAEKKGYPDEFEWIWSNYPSRGQNKGGKKSTHQACTARLKSGATWRELAEGMNSYKEYVTAKGDLGTSFVKAAKTFFGPDEHFKNQWNAENAKNENRNGRSTNRNDQRAELTNSTLEAGIRAAAERQRRETNAADGRTVRSNATEKATPGELLLSDRRGQEDSQNGVWTASERARADADLSDSWD